MSDDNKRNLHYFEAPSMRELFDRMQLWQEENNQRFLSLGVEKDKGKFCCIGLTNPTEVVITSGSGTFRAGVFDGKLQVTK